MRSHPIAIIVIALCGVGCSITRRQLSSDPADANPTQVDAAGLDARAPDAHRAIDAFSRLQDDAFAPNDASIARDAFTPPDAGCNGPDDDGDGLRDPCDPWPCGATPPLVAARVSEVDITLGNVSIDGRGAVVVAPSGRTLGASMDYVIVDGDCEGCIKQIEVGTVPGMREGCIYSGDPPSGAGASGRASSTFTMPVVTRPTRIDLRFNRRQDYTCGRNWWGGTPTAPPAIPGPSRTFGVVCVVP